VCLYICMSVCICVCICVCVCVCVRVRVCVCVCTMVGGVLSIAMVLPCSRSQCVAVSYSGPCVAVCCSVLQFVAAPCVTLRGQRARYCMARAAERSMHFGEERSQYSGAEVRKEAHTLACLRYSHVWYSHV